MCYIIILRNVYREKFVWSFDIFVRQTSIQVAQENLLLKFKLQTPKAKQR